MSGSQALRFFFCALGAVSMADAAGQGDATFDEVKRDLRALPSSQGKIGAEIKTSSAKADFSKVLSPIVSAAPVSGESTSDAATTAARSSNWLLDGLANLENEALAKKKLSESAYASDGDSSSPPDLNASLKRENLTSSKASVSNPLSPYLVQWLTPRDLALLQQKDSGSQRSASFANDRFQRTNPHAYESRLTSAAAAIPPSGIPPLGASLENFRSSGDLDEKQQVSVLHQSPSTLSPQQTPTKGFAAPGIVPGAPTAMVPSTQIHTAPVEAAPPTSRIVDDRKYFPQLRRF